MLLLNSTEHGRAWPRYYHNVYDNRNFLGMCAHVSYLHNVECVANMDLWTYVLAFLCVGGDSSKLRETAFYVFQPPMQKVHEICTI